MMLTYALVAALAVVFLVVVFGAFETRKTLRKRKARTTDRPHIKRPYVDVIDAGLSGRVVRKG